MRSTHRERRPSPVWGDGFAEDGWSDLAAVDTWDRVSRDEAVRLFPRLVPHRGQPAGQVVAHLTEMVAARAWRLRHLFGRDHALTSMTPAAVEMIGADRHPLFFASSGRIAAAWERCRGGGTGPAMLAEEHAGLSMLDAVLREVQTGALAPASPAQTATFAFLAGLHPAYLWPSAAIAPGRDTTAGWLGVLARRRAALMPCEVAENLADAIVLQDGRPVLRDRQLTQFALGAAAPDALHRAATVALRGTCPLVRRPMAIAQGRPLLRDTFPGWGMSARMDLS